MRLLVLASHGPTSAEVHLLAVRPAAHRRGIGRTLMAASGRYRCRRRRHRTWLLRLVEFEPTASARFHRFGSVGGLGGPVGCW